MTFSTQNVPVALHAALFFAALFLAAALVTGVWKWRAMLASREGEAHRYVDIAHHAALHYGPTIALAGVLAVFWPFGALLPSWSPVAIMGVSMVGSLSRYISLGVRGGTTNQLRNPDRASRLGLVFFFFGVGLPGLLIAFGALIGLSEGLPGAGLPQALVNP